MAPYCALQDTMHASWSAMDRMKRRDVAGDRGSRESGNKFYSEGAQFSSCWEIPQARTAARVELGPLGSKADLARTAAQSGHSHSIAFNGAPSAFARASADKTSAQVPEKEWIDDSNGCGSLSW